MLPLWRIRISEQTISRKKICLFKDTFLKPRSTNNVAPSFHSNVLLWTSQPKKYFSTKKGTADKSKVSIEKYLNQFLLQVHPDFFHQQPDLQKTNQGSLQKLNSLLELIRNPGDGLDKLPKRMDLVFWLKPTGDTIKFDSVQVSIDLQMKKQDSSTFLTASGVRMMLEEKLEDSLFGLFLDAGIKLPYSLTQEIQDRRSTFYTFS
jgi:hypothetical protein